MAKKTNKTSHVMDLLTNGSSEESEDPVSEAASPIQEKKNDVQSHTVTPTKVTVVDEGSRNDRLSQEILGKLAEELEAEQKEQSTQNTASDEIIEDMDITNVQDSFSPPSQSDSEPLELDKQEIIEQEQENLSEDISNFENAEDLESIENISDIQPVEESPQSSPTVGETQQEAVPISSEMEEAAQAEDGEQKDSQEQSPSNIPFKKEMRSIFPQSNFVAHAQDNAYQFLNVMEQVLMRQDLDSILKKHGVCTCPRCMSDVCALVLTGLPSKYVVTDKDSISPLISYYENKHKVQILAQLMMACDKVREHPRHRKE